LADTQGTGLVSNKIIINLDNYFIHLCYLCPVYPHKLTLFIMMKKFLRSTGVLALALGFVAVSCKPDDPEETLNAPGNPTTSEVTQTTAVFTWVAPANAESFLLRINNATPVSLQANTFTATGLTPDTEYRWSVQAVKGDLRSAWAAERTFRTLAVGVPTGLAAKDVTFESANLTWGAVADATGYEVRINDGTPVAVAANVLTHALTGLTPETQYTWTVRSISGEHRSAWATDNKFTTAALAIDVPSNLATSDITFNSATLTWDAVTGASGYEVRIGGANPVAVTNPTYALTGLDPDTEYTWTVRTVAGTRNSEWADEVTFSTVTLGAPTGLTAGDVTLDAATLTWGAVTGATGYEVRIDNGTPVPASATIHNLTGLTPATTYTWTVRAVAGAITSAWAEAATFVTKTPVTPVTFIEAGGTFYDEWYGTGTANYMVQFVDFDFSETSPSGWQLLLDIISVPTNKSSNVQYVDIPAGTYTLRQSYDTGTVVLNESDGGSDYTTFLKQVNAGYYVTPIPTVTGGTVTISGDHTNYTITMEVIHSGGTFYGEYTGPILIQNPDYLSGEIINFGRLPLYDKIYYYADGYGDGTADIYQLQGMDPGVSVVDGYLVGEGWIVGIARFHAAVGAGAIIPDGTYTVSNSYLPGTVLSGYVTSTNSLAGLWARDLTTTGITNIAITSGTVTSTYTAGAYEIDFDMFGTNGANYVGTIYSTAGSPVGSMPQQIAKDQASPYAWQGYSVQKAIDRAVAAGNAKKFNSLRFRTR
jgi:uncharacterized protein YmfQ (DUF2313 family)